MVFIITKQYVKYRHVFLNVFRVLDLTYILITYKFIFRGVEFGSSSITNDFKQRMHSRPRLNAIKIEFA